MFSTEERCIYGANCLGEVLCQFRFPQILAIQAELPVQFQEAIRQEFPRYTCRKEIQAPKPGAVAQEAQAINNHQFTTVDGVWRVNLTSSFISLACTRYTCWEDFARMLDKPLASFIKIYKPAYFERVGLRYLNFLSRKALNLEGTPFRELINSCWLGPLGEEELSESAASRCSVDTEFAIRGGCRAKIHAGPGLVKRDGQQDPEVKFIFDQDLYMTGNLAVNLSAGAINTLHSQAFPIFRGAITYLLHNAMEPEYL